MDQNSISDFPDPKMAASQAFDTIITQVKLSNLNFRIEMTPFAATIVLKKSLIKDKSGYPILPPLETYLPSSLNQSNNQSLP